MDLAINKYLKDMHDSFNGLQQVDGKLRVSSQTYLQNIAEGEVPNHDHWTKIGYNPTLTNTEADLWSATGVINFPTAAMQMEVLSSDNAADIGTVIKTGTVDSGDTSHLEDAAVDFTAATAAAVGDLVILDGDVDEYGFITGVDTHTLTITNGFSRGGSPAAGVPYRVVDKSATAGAQVVQVEYLNGSWITKYELVALNGTTVVPTAGSDLYRINSFRVVGAGANGKPTGNITIRNLADTPVYSYILAGYTRARNSAYTIPAGKALYVTEFTVSFGYAANQTHYARLYTRATQNREFRTPGIFYPFTEVVCANSSQQVPLDIPTKLLQKVDIKVSGISSIATGGIAAVALRGWLENDD